MISIHDESISTDFSDRLDEAIADALMSHFFLNISSNTPKNKITSVCKTKWPITNDVLHDFLEPYNAYLEKKGLDKTKYPNLTPDEFYNLQMMVAMNTVKVEDLEREWHLGVFRASVPLQYQRIDVKDIISLGIIKVDEIEKEWDRRNYLFSILSSDQHVDLQTMLALEIVTKDDFQKASILAHYVYHLVEQIKSLRKHKCDFQHAPLRLIFCNLFMEGFENDSTAFDLNGLSLFEIFSNVGQRLTEIINIFWTENIFLKSNWKTFKIYQEMFGFFDGLAEDQTDFDALMNLPARKEDTHPEIMRDLLLILLALGKENVAHRIWLLGDDQLSTALVASSFLRELSHYAWSKNCVQWAKQYLSFSE